MDIDIIRDPVNIIKINNVFSDLENKAILEEIIYNKNKFTASEAGGVKNNKMRTNTVALYDDIYTGHREHSVLLGAVDNLFSSDKFIALLSSLPIPFRLFHETNTHETQVSRYSDTQKYDWHVDTRHPGTRILTLVYYVNSEPKKYSGGEIMFSNSPTYKGKLMEKNPDKILSTPENNTAYVFDSTTSHCVLPTVSSKDFKHSRFSANIWIGRK